MNSILGSVVPLAMFKLSCRSYNKYNEDDDEGAERKGSTLGRFRVDLAGG